MSSFANGYSNNQIDIVDTDLTLVNYAAWKVIQYKYKVHL